MDLRGGEGTYWVAPAPTQIIVAALHPIFTFAPSMVVLSCAVLGGSNSNFNSKDLGSLNCNVTLWPRPQDKYLVFCAMVLLVPIYQNIKRL